MEVLIILGLAGGAMAAAGFEIWLATNRHPRRFALAWMAWTPVALLALAIFALSAGGSEAFSVLLAAPLAYPVARLWAYLEYSRYTAREEAAKERERLEYRAMDFGGPPESPSRGLDSAAGSSALSGAVMAQPIVTTLATSALARATTEKRSKLATRLEWAVMGFAAIVAAGSFVGFFAWDVFALASYDPDGAVIDTLEQRGFAVPRLEEAAGERFCIDGDGFRWSAVGAQGRACVDGEAGHVSLWVDRRWPRGSVLTAQAPHHR